MGYLGEEVLHTGELLLLKALGDETLAELRCPACGVVCSKESVVGTTRVYKHGRATFYQVVSCSCGRIFRGDVVPPPARGGK